MTSLIADVLLLVISLSGILRGISSKIENLLPLIGAKSFAFGRIEGTQNEPIVWIYTFSSWRDLVLGIHNACRNDSNEEEEWQEYFLVLLSKNIV